MSRRAWWITAAVCQALNVLVFAAAVGACIHWLVRVQTKEYCDTHRGADPDGMILAQALMLGVCVVAAGAVAYAMVGTCLTLTKHRAGPIMLLLSFPVTVIAGALALAELCREQAALQNRLMEGIAALAIAGLVVGWIASTMPQRPKRRVTAVPAPYTGGSPYVRPPGT